MQENPEASRTDAFRAVAARWKDDPSNPKNAPETPGAESEAADDVDAEAPEEQEGATDKEAASTAAAPAAATDDGEAAEPEEAKAKAEAEKQSTAVEPEATTVDTA